MAGVFAGGYLELNHLNLQISRSHLNLSFAIVCANGSHPVDNLLGKISEELSEECSEFQMFFRNVHFNCRNAWDSSMNVRNNVWNISQCFQIGRF